MPAGGRGKMGMKSKLEKCSRWFNIWKTQFEAAKAKSIHCQGETGRVLIIKLDAIGDFIIWLDAAKEFRNIYPDKRLVLMCAGASGSLAEKTGYFDEINTFDIRKFESDNNYKKQVVEQISAMSFDVLIQTAYSRTVHMDYIAACIPAAVKIGFEADESRTNLSRYIASDSNKKKLDKIYDRLIPTTKELLMEVKRNGDLIKGLGMKDFKSRMPYLKEQDIDKEIIPKEDYCVLFPGASTPKKMWSIKNFAKVADYIYNKTGMKCVVCGSSEEAHLYNEIEMSVARAKLINYCGKTSLVELAEIIRSAKFVVSNDTSGIHFAAAVNTPSVCILGEYNYGRFLPYDCDNMDGASKMIICNANMPCKRCAVDKMTKECTTCMASTGRYLCVDTIDAQRVIETVDEIIDTCEV